MMRRTTTGRSCKTNGEIKAQLPDNQRLQLSRFTNIFTETSLLTFFFSAPNQRLILSSYVGNPKLGEKSVNNILEPDLTAQAVARTAAFLKCYNEPKTTPVPPTTTPATTTTTTPTTTTRGASGECGK